MLYAIAAVLAVANAVLWLPSVLAVVWLVVAVMCAVQFVRWRAHR